MAFTLEAQSSASVPVPAAGEFRVFIDSADSILKTKDSSDVVRPFGVGTSTDLATTANPVAIDGGGAPAVGDILVATATSPAPAATWQSPSAAKVNTPVKQTAVQNGVIAATWGQAIRVDLTGGNATINLPTAIGNADAEIAVKIIGAASGNTCTIVPFGAQTLDGAANFVMTADNQKQSVRSDGANVMKW